MTGRRVREGSELRRDDQRSIQRVFATYPIACIHVIQKETGIPYPALLVLLEQLVKEEVLERRPEAILGDDHQYLCWKKPSNRRFNHVNYTDDNMSPVSGLTEAQMRDRVVMIKNMKARLIISWHPVLDILLADYEQELRRIEAIREPPEKADEEFDPMDHDIDVLGD